MNNFILYGCNGSGFGHIDRMLSIVNNMPEQNFVVLTSADKLNHVAQHSLASPNIISVAAGPKFEAVRRRHGGVSMLRTLFHAGRFSKVIEPAAMEFIDKLNRTSLNSLCGVISDFEPISCEVGRKLGIPVATVDSQHRFSRLNAPEFLSIKQQMFWNAAGSMVSKLMGESAINIIPSIYGMNHRPRSVRRLLMPGSIVSSVIRSEIMGNRIFDDGFAVVVVQPDQMLSVASVLNKVGVPSRIYSAGSANIKFGQAEVVGDFSRDSLHRDLCRCSFVVGNGSYQLISEAMHLGKKFIALKVKGHTEHDINIACASRYGSVVRAGDKLQAKNVSDCLALPKSLHYGQLNSSRNKMDQATVVSLVLKDLFGLSGIGE